MTDPGSRYAEVARRSLLVDTADGQVHAVLPIRFLPPVAGWYHHTVVSGDRLDLLAATYYGRADRFWVIADANPLIDPEELLVPGTRIVIPPDRAG
ncbi:LysM peptidoglycan-binding domain-containing protein [Streptomyces coeruleoprunus]|uniref:LysM peptidoglycan-binding domain-containing protein n=1 Tax=Streptomyces coeruleoprunus TaxID=285563 RepID=A0ABV9XDZ0_9ACTN